jgi:hypothetical protein
VFQQVHVSRSGRESKQRHESLAGLAEASPDTGNTVDLDSPAMEQEEKKGSATMQQEEKKGSEDMEDVQEETPIPPSQGPPPPRPADADYQALPLDSPQRVQMEKKALDWWSKKVDVQAESVRTTSLPRMHSPYTALAPFGEEKYLPSAARLQLNTVRYQYKLRLDKLAMEAARLAEGGSDQFNSESDEEEPEPEPEMWPYARMDLLMDAYFLCLYVAEVRQWTEKNFKEWSTWVTRPDVVPRGEVITPFFDSGDSTFPRVPIRSELWHPDIDLSKRVSEWFTACRHEVVIRDKEELKKNERLEVRTAHHAFYGRNGRGPHHFVVLDMEEFDRMYPTVMLELCEIQRAVDEAKKQGRPLDSADCWCDIRGLLSRTKQEFATAVAQLTKLQVFLYLQDPQARLPSPKTPDGQKTLQDMQRRSQEFNAQYGVWRIFRFSYMPHTGWIKIAMWTLLWLPALPDRRGNELLETEAEQLATMNQRLRQLYNHTRRFLHPGCSQAGCSQGRV